MINIYYDGFGFRLGDGYGDGDGFEYGDGDGNGYGDPIYKIEFQRFMNLE
jgi:hypothetical protein